MILCKKSSKSSKNSNSKSQIQSNSTSHSSIIPNKRPKVLLSKQTIHWTKTRPNPMPQNRSMSFIKRTKSGRKMCRHKSSRENKKKLSKKKCNSQSTENLCLKNNHFQTICPKTANLSSMLLIRKAPFLDGLKGFTTISRKDFLNNLSKTSDQPSTRRVKSSRVEWLERSKIDW